MEVFRVNSVTYKKTEKEFVEILKFSHQNHAI